MTLFSHRAYSLPRRPVRATLKVTEWKGLTLPENHSYPPVTEVLTLHRAPKVSSSVDLEVKVRKKDVRQLYKMYSSKWDLELTHKGGPVLKEVKLLVEHGNKGGTLEGKTHLPVYLHNVLKKGDRIVFRSTAMSASKIESLKLTLLRAKPAK